MKKILIAIAAVLSLGTAVAQDRWHDEHDRDREHREWHRDEPRGPGWRGGEIPDRVERHIVKDRHGRDVVVIQRYSCAFVGPRGFCRRWERV